jgi:hypothetical protein
MNRAGIGGDPGALPEEHASVVNDLGAFLAQSVAAINDLGTFVEEVVQGRRCLGATLDNLPRCVDDFDPTIERPYVVQGKFAVTVEERFRCAACSDATVESSAQIVGCLRATLEDRARVADDLGTTLAEHFSRADEFSEKPEGPARCDDGAGEGLDLPSGPRTCRARCKDDRVGVDPRPHQELRRARVPIGRLPGSRERLGLALGRRAARPAVLHGPGALVEGVPHATPYGERPVEGGEAVCSLMPACFILLMPTAQKTVARSKTKYCPCCRLR